MVKVYVKKVYLSKDLLRFSKIHSKHFRTNNNHTLILPFFLWRLIEIYNGKKYIPISINKKKVGFTLNKFIFQDKKKSVTTEFNIKINN